MNEHIVQFLVNLSHRWLPIVSLILIVSVIANHFAGILQKRARAGTDLSARRASRALRLITMSLVVISIGGCGLSISHYGCAILVSESSKCSSNMRQLGKACAMYSQDYDGRMPLSALWSDEIDSRVKESARSDLTVGSNPFKCPVAESKWSYGMNKNVGGLVGDDIDRPADIVLLFEADAPIRSYSGGLIDVTKERHYGYSNIAFVDGHVKKFNAIGLQALVWLPEKVKLQQ